MHLQGNRGILEITVVRNDMQHFTSHDNIYNINNPHFTLIIVYYPYASLFLFQKASMS